MPSTLSLASPLRQLRCERLVEKNRRLVSDIDIARREYRRDPTPDRLAFLRELETRLGEECER